MLDKNEAPEGYIAEAETTGCHRCDFLNPIEADHFCARFVNDDNIACAEKLRKDGHGVVFRKRKDK